MGRKVRTADLVAASGVAERTLRKHFRDFVGVSPLSYLRHLRLAAVRDELTGGADAVSITDVATRHGFTHLGSFSLDHRRLFGELPSGTVRKRRRDAERSAGCDQLRSVVGLAREKRSVTVLPLDVRATEPAIRNLVGNFAAGASEKIAITLSRSRSLSVVAPAPSRTRGADPNACDHGICRLQEKLPTELARQDRSR
jgi:AraC-like DNA-binding protein